ncbi:MAG: hypothetical protein AAGD14_10780 [Planctomycetota bacterium]
MYGGLAVVGSDRLLYAQHDGELILLAVEEGTILDAFSPRPCSPPALEITAAAVDEGRILLADRLHRRVRVVDFDGRPIALLGRTPPVGIRSPDEPGTLSEPVWVLPQDGGAIVVNSDEFEEHAVQRFDRRGRYVSTFVHPLGGYYRAHGAARIGDEIWVAETVGGAVRRYAPDGTFLGDLNLHTELQRPFRLADDGYDGVFALLAPEEEEEQEVTGVARLDREGTFEGWVVTGEEVNLPFDVAVLPDGRFVVADLPYGGPPDVRVQLFGADGRRLHTLFTDRVELAAMHGQWRTELEQSDGSWLRKAQVAAAQSEAKAEELFRLALAEDPDDLLPYAGLGALYQHVLDKPAAAAEAWAAAIERGAPEAEFTARIAECRHALGDRAGAIALLQPLLEAPELPEEPEKWLELLGTWLLEEA